MSRSGFYKWRARAGRVPADRKRILELVQSCHDKHPSHGYRWVHAYLAKHAGTTVSAEYIRRCFKYLGIAAKTTHQKKSHRRRVRDPYPNLIFSTWETVDRPRQVIVSDMTAFWTRTGYFELVLYFDVFTKQILGHGLTGRRGYAGIYYEGLNEAIEAIDEAKLKAIGRLNEESGEITLIHTDQGSVYTSLAYNEIIKDRNIVRSCSRAGKPTDNPVNESLNGWIKEELFLDFDLYNQQSSRVPEVIKDYIKWYNSKRPSFSLGYKTPDEFFEQFMAGDIEHKDTFAKRQLDKRPKFIREKLKRAEEAARYSPIGTSTILCN